MLEQISKLQLNFQHNYDGRCNILKIFLLHQDLKGTWERLELYSSNCHLHKIIQLPSRPAPHHFKTWSHARSFGEHVAENIYLMGLEIWEASTTPHIADDELETIRGGANPAALMSFCRFLACPLPSRNPRVAMDTSIVDWCWLLIFPAIDLHVCFFSDVRSHVWFPEGTSAQVAGASGQRGQLPILQHRGRALAMPLLEESLGGAQRDREVAGESHLSIQMTFEHNKHHVAHMSDVCLVKWGVALGPSPIVENTWTHPENGLGEREWRTR